MNLPEGSRTAIQSLVCRALEDERRNRENQPPMSAFCLAQLLAASSFEDKKFILREIRICSGAARYGFLIRTIKRSSMIDSIAASYIAGHPGCAVVDLGCGFDTRFWRLNQPAGDFIEIDVPEIIDLKRELLGNFIPYALLGRSALDSSWIDAVIGRGNGGYLLIAEGLFRRLAEADALRFLRVVGARFRNSRIVFDTANRAFTDELLAKLAGPGRRPARGAGRFGDARAKVPDGRRRLAAGFGNVSVTRTGRDGAILSVGIHEPPGT